MTPTDRAVADLMALSGMRRSLEVGVRIAPTPASAVAAAKGLSALLEDVCRAPVRLAGLGSGATRVHVTLAVGLGEVDGIRLASPCSQSALVTIKAIIDHCAAYDPAFVTLPALDSIEARIAQALSAAPKESWTLESAVRDLVDVRLS